MSFIDQLAILNDAVISEFATDLILYQPAGTVPAQAVNILAIPLDPLRKEQGAIGNFTVRWVRLSDFIAAGIIPKHGDTVTIPDTILTIGGDFTVNQVQEENAGGGVTLILNRKAKK